MPSSELELGLFSGLVKTANDVVCSRVLCSLLICCTCVDQQVTYSVHLYMKQASD